MTNEELILRKLETIEAELLEIRSARETLQELKKDLNPLVKQSFYVLLRELGQVESGFQLEDIFHLMKRFLRNIRNIAEAMDMLENAMDLWKTMEPLMKSAVHHGVRELGVLEERGVFRTYKAMLDVRAKVAQHYGPEDIEAMGDSFVAMLGLLKKMSDPKMVELLDKLTELPKTVNLAEAKPAGVMSLLSAMRDPDTKQGIGVALEMTKALGKLK